MDRMMKVRIIIGVLIVVGIMAGLPAGVVAQSDMGLVGEWHFDGDAKDSSGNGNDGTVYGASFVDGKFGKALRFDGVDDYVRVPDSSIWDFGIDDITVNFWFTKFDAVRGHALSFGSSGAKNNLAFDFDDKDSGGKGVWVYWMGGGMPHVWAANTFHDGSWHYLSFIRRGNIFKLYIDGNIIDQTTDSSNLQIMGDLYIGTYFDKNQFYFNGLIDEVRIYDRALSADEIKAHYEGKQTALTLTKTASPYSIKQGQTTTITLTIKNTGTTDIANIEIMDSIHRNFDLISGDFPNPKRYDVIGKGESREIQYMIKAKESGTFNLDPATGIYADKDGNIQEAKSEPFSVKVITNFEPTPIKTSAPAMTPEITTNPVKTASVSLYGEKTDVVLGEDILLKLSAVNLITKPQMHVQVIIIPPSGMSVTSSEFSKIAAGQFTANYELPPGDGRDIEVSIRSNQIGDFNVNGRIIYYFGDDKVNAEDHNLNLPIKVRKDIASVPTQNPTEVSAQKSIPGFNLIIGISALLSSIILKRRLMNG